MMDRREFIADVFKLGGFGALVSMGLIEEARAIAPAFLERASQTPVVAGCDTIEDSEVGANESAKSPFQNSIQDWWGAKLVVDSSYTVCAVDAYLQRSATDPNYNITAYIYTDNGGEPGTQVGTGSDAVASVNIATSVDWLNFPNMAAAVSTGTYWTVLTSDDTDAVNGVFWFYAAVAGDNIFYSGDGSSWTGVNNGDGLKYRTYK